MTSKNVITISDAAVAQIKRVLSDLENKSVGIRIGVKSGGCSGLSYKFEYAQSVEPSDEVVEVGGVSVFIEQQALIYLMGMKLDYVDHKVRSGFVFINPNEKGTCGCGSSFYV
ncbi:iron-sulfur cluster assembly accessory protein [Rickettsiales endosymbiont of Peranema trichophorum]|uniref:HesB/IscA family protein n=1 Tax=Rickettsiales endosymbiont of Peranema trichophorum TaxID=2486577 RepID=UPI0010238A6D|nr:iron-sulfur cluster assembly accessory protein [Rickettsiales endosymbiont of Peranema trichophorum]RZI47736.1 iron-sulfur cluster assembly accessory protein [Rickettsiales endosymbiont of Peranema trichophorum]